MFDDDKTLTAATQSSHAPGKKQNDYLSEPGARALAAKIREYWTCEGRQVMLTLQRDGTNGEGWVVRSDMLGGPPRPVHDREPEATP